MHRMQSRLMGMGLAAVLCGVYPALAATAPPLGQAGSFSVLGGTTVTNTGPTIVNGNLGVSPGSAVTGFPVPGTVVGGSIHAADALAAQAQLDATTAYNNLAAQACTTTFGVPTDLGGMTLTPGVYCFASSAAVTGLLRLDALGNPNAVFVFKTVSTFITASGSSILVVNGGSNCNVFYQVGSDATLNTTSTVPGTIIALTSISLKTGATLNGRAIARNAAVTLDSNNVGGCAVAAVVCPVITVNPPTLPNGNVGTFYGQLITASGGTAPYTFAVSSGTLPVGLTLTAGGTLSGTPTTVGTSNFTITATDSNVCPGSRAYSIVIAAAGVPPGPVGPASGPTLDSFGLAILLGLLAVAGMFAVNRFTS